MFYLNLSKKSDITFSQTFRFVQRTITLGKDVSNNLRLYCPDESISDIHAEIYSDMGNTFIVDKGSGSGTYIENLKLVKNRSYLLREGIQILIGEYILTFHLSPSELDTEMKEMFIVNTISCLEDVLAYVNKMREHNPELYAKNMKEKLNQVFDINENQKLRTLLIQIIDPDNNHDGENTRAESFESDFIVDMFLKLFVEFHSMSSKISDEFIDSHTIHRRDSKQIVFPDSLRRFILDTKVSVEERNRRINFLWNEIEDLVSKHIALFEGYKSSIKHGTRDLLKELDPLANIGNEQKKAGYFKSYKILQKYFSFLRKLRNAKRILDKYETISKNIEKEIEQKFFQPAFKSGYLKKFNSMHNTEDYLNY